MPPDRPHVIPANEYRRERWHNQLGWTREIARGGGVGGEWGWRLSIAEIEREGGFSTFPGVDRELVLLSGNGLRLAFEHGDEVVLEPPHGRHAFAGERGLGGAPLDGTVHAFNLMWRRADYHADLWHRPLVGPMVLFAEPGSTWAVHLVAGHARFADGSGLPRMDAGDTLLLPAAGERARQVLDGGGEVLVARISPASPPPQ